MELYRLIWGSLQQNSMFVFAALTLIVCDFVFGFAGAAKNGCISSRKMRDGLWHKFGSIGLMVVASIVDGALAGGVQLEFTEPVLIVTCLYISMMELVSVVENLTILNPDLADNPLVSKLAAKED